MAVTKYATTHIELDEGIQKGLLSSPSVRKSAPDFLTGIIESDRIDVEMDGLDPNVISNIESVDKRGKIITVKVQGSDSSTPYVLGSGKIESMSGKDRIKLPAQTLDTSLFDADLPKILIDPADFNKATDLGLAIPKPFGECLKSPLRYIDRNTDTFFGPLHFTYLAGFGNNITIDAVFREDTEVSTLEYTTSASSYTYNSTPLTTISFVVEQRDFSGSLHNLSANLTVTHTPNYNIITNSGFNTWGGGVPSSWSVGGNVTITQTMGIEQISDLYAAHITGGTGVSTTSNKLMSTTLALTNNQTYTLSFYAKMESGSNRLKVDVGSITSDAVSGIVVSDYMRYTYTFVGDGGNHQIGFYLGDGSDKFLIDNVQVTKGGLEVPYEDVNVNTLVTDRYAIDHLKETLVNTVWGFATTVSTSAYLNAKLQNENKWMISDGYLADKIQGKNVLDELAFLSRVWLDLDENGSWRFTPDTEKETIRALYASVDTKDDFDINEMPILDWDGRDRRDLSRIPKEVNVEYRFDRVKNKFLRKNVRSVDGGKAEARPVKFNFIKEDRTADRLTKYWVEWIKNTDELVRITVGRAAWQLNLGDLIDIRIPRRSITGVHMIVGMERSEDGVSMELVKYRPATYDYMEGTIQPGDDTDTDIAIALQQPDDITGLVVNSVVTGTAADGVTYSKFTGTFTPPTQLFADCLVQMKEDAEVIHKTVALSTDGNWETPPVVAGLIYDLRFRVRSPYAQLSDGVDSDNNLALGDSSAPAVPTGLANTQVMLGTATWKWNSNSESDIKEYPWRLWTASSGGTLVSTGAVSNPEVSIPIKESSNLETTVTRFIEVAAKDLSDNQSSYSSRVGATSRRVLTEDVLDNEITEKFSAFTSGGVSVPSPNEVTVQSVFTVINGSNPVHIWASVNVDWASGSVGPGSVQVKVYRGSSQLIRQDVHLDVSQSQGVSLNIRDTPGAGGHTYSLRVQHSISAGNISANNRSIIVQEQRR